MTRSEIVFNYRQALRQADKLDEIARKIEKLAAEKIDNTTGNLKSVWKSDNSSQYCGKVVEVQRGIRWNAASIRKVANSIRETAENIKRAELRALEIAQSRSYK